MKILDKLLNILKIDDYDEKNENENSFDKQFDNQDEDLKEKSEYDLFDFMKKNDSNKYSRGIANVMNSKQLTNDTPNRKIKKAIRSRTNNAQVLVLRPSNVDDSKEIIESLCFGRTVLLNLESQELDVSQRIIDFTSGALLAINGNLQKVGNCIFLLTPNGVNVAGDVNDMLADQFDL